MPIAQAFFLDDPILEQVSLDAIVTLVDAKHIEQHLDERRRRFYKVTAEGRRVLAHQRQTWEAFVEAVRRVTGDDHA